MRGKLVGVGPVFGHDLHAASTTHRDSGVSPEGTPRPLSVLPTALNYFLVFHLTDPTDHVAVISVDNVTGGLHFRGVPSVDLFLNESVAFQSLESMTAIHPDGVRAHVLYHFAGWCGAYVTDEWLHMLFVSETSGVGGSTAACRCSNTPRQPCDGAIGDIHRADVMTWKSFRLQCPQSSLFAPLVTVAHRDRVDSTTPHHVLHSQHPQHAGPSSGREICSSDKSFSSTDGGEAPAVPPAFPPSIASASLAETGRSFYFAESFDLCVPRCTESFVKEGRITCAVNSPRFRFSTVALLRPDASIELTEMTWNIELIRCVERMANVGDFCVRLMYGSIQVTSCCDDDAHAGTGIQCILVSRISRMSLRSACTLQTTNLDIFDRLGNCEMPSEGSTERELHSPFEAEIQLLVVAQNSENEIVSEVISSVALRGQRLFRAEHGDDGQHWGDALLVRSKERRMGGAFEDVFLAKGGGLRLSSSVRSPTSTSISPSTVSISGGRVTEAHWAQAARRLNEDDESGPSETTAKVEVARSLSEVVGIRCVVADEKQLGSSALTMFLWFVFVVGARSLVLKDVIFQYLQQRSVFPGEHSVLRVIWRLLASEMSSQFLSGSSAPTDAFFSVMEIARQVLVSTHCTEVSGHGCSSSNNVLRFLHSVTQTDSSSGGRFPPGWFELNAALTLLQTHESVDHRHSAFLQFMVEAPRHWNVPCEAAPPSVLLSDYRMGASIIRAVASTPSDGLVAATQKIHCLTNLNLDSSPPIPLLPSMRMLFGVLMPKSPAVYLPEGCASLELTIALPSLSRVTHFGLQIPTAQSEAMFAAALSVSLTSSEYMTLPCARVLLLDAPLPIALGIGGTASSMSLAVFAVQQLVTGSAEELPRDCIGRFFTVTLKASGKIPMLIGPLLLFGQDLSFVAPAQRQRWLAGPTMSSTSIGSSLRNTMMFSSRDPTTGAALTNNMSGVCMGPREAVPRFLRERYVPLHLSKRIASETPHSDLWHVSGTPHHYRVRSGIPQHTASSQHQERFKVNETQRDVLLHGRMLTGPRISLGVDGSYWSSHHHGGSDTSQSRGTSPPPRSPVTREGNTNLPRVVSADRSRDSSPLTSPRGSSRAFSPIGGSSLSLQGLTSTESQAVEEQFLLHLIQLVSNRSTSSIGLIDVAQLEATRIRMCLPKSVRDRCCLRVGIPCWVLDIASHIHPRGAVWENQQSKRNKSNVCQRCKSRLTFLSTKKECYRCGDRLCVKCAVDNPVRLLELGLRDAAATVCNLCLVQFHRVESALMDVAKAFASASISVPDHSVLTHRGPSSAWRAYAQRTAASLAPLVPAVDTIVGSAHQSAASMLHQPTYPLTLNNCCQVLSASHRGFECVLGHCQTPGRGWPCYGHEDPAVTAACTVPVVVQRIVKILLPQVATITSICVQCHRAPSSIPPAVAPPDEASITTKQGRRDVTFTWFISDNLQFHKPVYHFTESQATPCASSVGTWVFRTSSLLSHNNGDAERCTGRIVCVRISGSAADVAGLELLHVSLWGRYIPSTLKPHEMLPRRSFFLSGPTSSAQIYGSLRKRNGSHNGSESSVRHHSFLSGVSGAAAAQGSAIASMGPGNVSSGPAGHTLPQTLFKTRMLPSKCSPLALHSVGATSIASTFQTYEYDFGVIPQTVCGFILEQHHPAVAAGLGFCRIALAVRCIGIGHDGRRGNIAVVALPFPLLPAPPQSLLGLFDERDRVDASPVPSMAFAFPTSNHDLRAVQMEVIDHTSFRHFTDSQKDPTTFTPSGTNTGGSLQVAAGTTGSHTPASVFLGRVVFWTSSESQTRRLVSSATFTSVFSSKPS